LPSPSRPWSWRGSVCARSGQLDEARDARAEQRAADAQARAEQRAAEADAAAVERRRVAYERVLDRLGELEAAVLVPMTATEYRGQVAGPLRLVSLAIRRLPDADARARLLDCHEVVRMAGRDDADEFDTIGVALGAIDYGVQVAVAAVEGRELPDPQPVMRQYLFEGVSAENPWSTGSDIFDIGNAGEEGAGIFEYAARWRELGRPRLRRP
jgi:hypothetical protein